jgi:hypothetical protein
MMPKYKVRVVETIAQVAYAYIDAKDEADAWEKADNAALDIPSSAFKIIDGSLEVTDVEEESENETTP